MSKLEEKQQQVTVSNTKPLSAPPPETDERTKSINTLKGISQIQLNSMKGETVYHQKFGAGKIDNISKDYLWVKFEEPYGNKQFQFPEALIDGHLRLKK